jgi:hypothetical protein
VCVVDLVVHPRGAAGAGGGGGGGAGRDETHVRE